MGRKNSSFVSFRRLDMICYGRDCCCCGPLGENKPGDVTDRRIRQIVAGYEANCRADGLNIFQGP